MNGLIIFHKESLILEKHVYKEWSSFKNNLDAFFSSFKAKFSKGHYQKGSTLYSLEIKITIFLPYLVQLPSN